MPAPIAPIAWTALRFGAVAATAYVMARRTQAAPKHVWREAALDDTAEGIELTTDRSESEANGHAAARLNRTFRLRTGGPGLEVDLAALGRVRFRRVE